MLDSSSKESSSGGAPVTEKIERRARVRYEVTVTAELTELNTGARVAARTTDLSEGGCFVDTMAPLPAGSQIRVHLSKGEEVFEALGKVLYSQQGLGMGIAFTKVGATQRTLLNSWLAQVSGQGQAGVETAQSPLTVEKAAAADCTLAVQLVHLLVERRILTEEDGAKLLSDALL